MLNHTLFSKDNPSIKQAAWDSDSHFKYLAKQKIFNTKRSYERWVEKEKIFPINHDYESYVQLFPNQINNLLQNYFLKLYEKQRRLILYVQYFELKGSKFLFANDRRNGRLWVKIKSNKYNHLIEGLKSFSKIRKKNIIILPNPDLLYEFQGSEELNPKSKLSLLIPQFIFKKKEIAISETTFSKKFNLKKSSYLSDLEAESIHIIREVVSETKNPVMLYSVGKDSSVMLHLAKKAFYPSNPPFPLIHVDTRWKFHEMYLFRNWMAKKSNMKLITHINPEGVKANVNPFDHGSSIHTDIMKTQGLKQALDQYGFDAAFGGARRDEEKSRAKERIFSFRTANHQWDPKNQRPELWNLFNAKVNKSESIRVFPLSNWTELDIWHYIYQQNIEIVPLYFAKKRPVVERDELLIVVDDDRFKFKKNEKSEMKSVRFRTLGCYPLTGAVESNASNLIDIIQEVLFSVNSERQGRAIDQDQSASMEQKKRQGYF